MPLWPVSTLTRTSARPFCISEALTLDKNVLMAAHSAAPTPRLRVAAAHERHPLPAAGAASGGLTPAAAEVAPPLRHRLAARRQLRGLRRHRGRGGGDDAVRGHCGMRSVCDVFTDRDGRSPKPIVPTAICSRLQNQRSIAAEQGGLGTGIQ
jgi:hypothetical protein